MSRRGNNGVRGPASALTSYLREQNINTGPMNMYSRRGARRDAEAEAEPAPDAAADDATAEVPDETEGAGPSTEIVDEPETSTKKRKRGDDDDALDSDNLDSDAEEPKASTSKAASTAKAKGKAVETKTSAKAKAAAKKKAKKDGTYKSDDDDEDYEDEGFKAPSRMMMTGPRPAIGSMEPCAKCGKRFAVTKYTQAASPPPGYLCHACTKAAGIDPFQSQKKAPVRQKRKPEDKRKIVNFEEKDVVPSLALQCISIITNHIEDVEALGSIGTENMDTICKIISRNRKLNPSNAMLFYDVGNTSLTLYDCTLLEPPALQSLASLNPNLESLRLDFCGRMTDPVLQHFSSSLSSLRSIALLGPFNVRSSAWIDFLNSTSQPLEHFSLTQSPRFDLECLWTLKKRAKATLKTLRLKEMGQINDEWLGEIAHFKMLETLDISRPAARHSVSDDALIELLAVIGGGLKSLDISAHEELTDRALVCGVAAYCGALKEFVAADVGGLTDRGVAAFFGDRAPDEEPDQPREDDAGPAGDGVLPQGLQVGRRRVEILEDPLAGAGDVVMADGDAPAPAPPAPNPVDDVLGEDDEPPEEPSGDSPLALALAEDPPHVLPSLTHINLSRSPALSSRALRALLSHSGSTVQTLNIAQWRLCSNEALLMIGEKAPKSRKVNLAWCRQVDNWVVKALMDGCSDLKEVGCAGCNLLTSDCPRKKGVTIRGIEPGV